ncbi:Polyamine oxidase 1 [Pseudocercospora fuligena]|uniref:Polyamine oxidase 1 n=1 Tax=Pseudocercospora fuligena TaxID=685502 RepID=A0A8H6RKD9_9PEZI|nr:Polyamine oxidase 1 [Pseudocercospora fuligena]
MNDSVREEEKGGGIRADPNPEVPAWQASQQLYESRQSLQLEKCSYIFQQALTNASITDFIIVEHNDYIGGRVVGADFGKQSDGSPYRIELGANWIHGLVGEFENPVWILAQKYNLKHQIQDFDNLLSYNETGQIDIDDIWDAFEEASDSAAVEAGRLLKENVQDQTARTGFALAGWSPESDDMAAALVEWFGWDFSNGVAPEVSSFIFGITGENITYGLFGEDEPLVIDPRGYTTIIQGEAHTFLNGHNDPRLLLNTVVTNISWSDHGVTIHNEDGSCISAAYAINTFSLGVHQHGSVSYTPELPTWKQTAIQSFGMATYTKIFLQFPSTWWPEDIEFFGYASPNSRGYYPMFQSLSHPDFLPDSNIMFVTVTEEQAYRVERQSNEETQAEIMVVLKEMFPNITIPEPTAILYPRWSQEPWARGSYSYWPPSTSLQMHQNLRANVGRMFYAGEHISGQFYGFLHGSWYSGREMGERVAGLHGKKCLGSAGEPDIEACGELKHYEILEGVTPEQDYDTENGWAIDSVELENLDGEDPFGNISLM